MLRVITSHTVDILTFKLEGRLTGERAEQVRTLVTRSNAEMRLIVDITELMFVEALGEEVLAFLKRPSVARARLRMALTAMAVQSDTNSFLH